MKLVPLLILLAIAGGLAFVFINEGTRNWIFGQGEEGIFQAQGYKKATSPTEAMNLYAKAVKDRNYAAAARYCAGEYANQLVRAHAAAKQLGGYIDDIKRLVADKGYRTEQSDFLLNFLDPFPPFIKVLELKEGKKDSERTIGRFIMDGIPPKRMDQAAVGDLDARMFLQALAPPGIYNGAPYDLKKEGEHWKILFNFPMASIEQVTYFLDHYKSYVEGLREFKDDMNRGRFLKEQVAPELQKVLRASK